MATAPKKERTKSLLRLESPAPGQVLFRLMGPAGAWTKGLKDKKDKTSQLRALGMEAARLKGWLWILGGAESEIRISYCL